MKIYLTLDKIDGLDQQAGGADTVIVVLPEPDLECVSGAISVFNQRDELQEIGNIVLKRDVRRPETRRSVQSQKRLQVAATIATPKEM